MGRKAPKSALCAKHPPPADESPEPELAELWRDTIVEDGELDVKPRERVLGATVEWPSYPGPETKTTWDLEPAGRPGKKA